MLSDLMLHKASKPKKNGNKSETNEDDVVFFCLYHSIYVSLTISGNVEIIQRTVLNFVAEL